MSSSYGFFKNDKAIHHTVAGIIGYNHMKIRRCSLIANETTINQGQNDAIIGLNSYNRGPNGAFTGLHKYQPRTK